MSANWVTFLFEAGNFLLLALVLGWLFFRPVRDVLERRRSELEGERTAAAQARAEAERVLEDARAKRVELEKSREALEDDARKEGENERDKIIAKAREQADRERERLKEELVALRRAQGRSLSRDAAFAAAQIVTRLLERVDTPDLDQQLLSAACRELSELRRSGPLSSLMVETPRTATEEELVAIAKAADVPRSDVRDRVDESLVAGYRVVTSRGLVDVSVAGFAAQAEHELLNRIEGEEGGDG